jgi:hypothetical protein
MVRKAQESINKYKNYDASALTAVDYETHLGTTPGLLRGATVNTPGTQAQLSRGRGGWSQRKLSDHNRLRDQPKAVCY